MHNCNRLNKCMTIWNEYALINGSDLTKANNRMCIKCTVHMPICKAGIFSIGLISLKSSAGPLPPITFSSTGFMTYSMPFKFNAIRTRHAHELRQNEYNTGVDVADILLKRTTKSYGWTVDEFDKLRESDHGTREMCFRSYHYLKYTRKN